MRWVATAGVLMRIVRNFGILNMLLFIPTLSDQYNTGPSEVNLIINPTMRIGTLKKHNKKPAMARSKIRFIMFPSTDYADFRRFKEYFYLINPCTLCNLQTGYPFFNPFNLRNLRIRNRKPGVYVQGILNRS